MRPQQGFGAIAAIVVLVILALLAAAIVSMSATQQLTSAEDVLAARAWQAARAGNEWGLYQALKRSSCASAELDLSANTGFHVTVTCESWQYQEGGESVDGSTAKTVSVTVSVYRIKAVACPVSTGCPALDARVAAPGYVERTRLVLAWQ